MICKQCQEDRLESAFIKSDICFKCIYKNKSDLFKKNKLCKCCKICKKTIPHEKSIYWKSSYCSKDCAQQGKNEYNKNYWIHNIQVTKLNTQRLQYGKPKPI